MKTVMMIVSGLLLAGGAHAKLPPPSEEAKAKAEEAKVRAAWSGKVEAYKLCLAQDRAAAHYRNTHAEAKPPTETPACADPGPFAPPAAAPAPAVAEKKP